MERVYVDHASASPVNKEVLDGMIHYGHGGFISGTLFGDRDLHIAVQLFVALRVIKSAISLADTSLFHMTC